MKIPPRTFKGPYSGFANVAKVHLEEVHMYDFSTDSFIGLEAESSEEASVDVSINLATIRGLSQSLVLHQVILGSFLVANSNISNINHNSMKVRGQRRCIARYPLSCDVL